MRLLLLFLWHSHLLCWRFASLVYLVLSCSVFLTSRFDHQAVWMYTYGVGNFEFIMVPQILTRGQLEKMSNENLIAPCLALQDNIILQQNDVTTKQGHIEKSIGNNIQN